MFRGKAKRLHFVGIGGIGMSGIAEVLLNLGYDVRGSDLKISLATEHLQGLGATVYCGHHENNLGDAQVVIVSTAVSASNPEVMLARANGVQVIPRAEMLAELMRMKYGIAVAGTHGKTTTTSLIATLLGRGGFDPTVVIGGRLKSIRSNARLGAGQYMVAEADESDGSFLKLMPTIAVVTNIDAEHLDHWTGGLPEIVDAFVTFVNKVPFYGSAVVCLDHPTVQEMLPRLDKRIATYGFSAQADYRADKLSMRDGVAYFSVYKHGNYIGDITLNMVGKHNVLNAMAAIAVADEVGVEFSVIQEALASFSGIGRRFEVKGCPNDILVIDDYAHHPAEIEATITAAQDAYHRRIIVAFQPHRYSRTKNLIDGFSRCFNKCDKLYISHIYAASEAPINGVNSAMLADKIHHHGHQDVEAVGDLEALHTKLMTTLLPGDLLLTLGAGDIWEVAESVVGSIQQQSMSTPAPGPTQDDILIREKS